MRVLFVHASPFGQLEVYRRLGLNDDEILDDFPTLQIWDLQNAWAYVSANLEEIEQAIQESESQGVAIEAELRKEMKIWDSLSDEALLNFEDKSPDKWLAAIF